MSDTAKRARQSKAEPDQREWRSHRIASNAVRVVVFLIPVSGGAAVGLLVSRSIPGHATGAIVVRIILAAVSSIGAFLVAERLGRRFLPLAFLLRLNLVFPDRAPSRFSVALRSTSVRKLQQWVREAREADDATVLAKKVVTLASALNTHDRRTRGHCERTRALADLIVEELHLSATEANEVRWGAFLHDIGKLVVPAELLNKPGKPTSREWAILRSHPEAGVKLVEPLRAFLSSGVDAVGGHHENYDGTGYPAGLRGEQLALAARIVSVADSFEVMTAVRAYKRPMTAQAARAELARRSGSQFDPHVVRAFLNVSLGRLHWALGIAAWMAEVPFLTILPRLAAQVSTTAGGRVAISPIGLPGVAAASLGAMAVIGHVEPPTTPTVPPARASTVPDAQSSSHVTPRPEGESVPVAGPVGSTTASLAPTPPVHVADGNQVEVGAPPLSSSVQVSQGVQVDVGAGSITAPSPFVIAPPDIDILGSPVVSQGNLAGIGPSVTAVGTVLGTTTKGAVGDVIQAGGEIVTDTGTGVVHGLLGDIP